jgi:hypothetical protein
MASGRELLFLIGTCARCAYFSATSQIMYCPGPLAERTMPLTRCSRSVTPTRFAS